MVGSGSSFSSGKLGGIFGFSCFKKLRLFWPTVVAKLTQGAMKFFCSALDSFHFATAPDEIGYFLSRVFFSALDVGYQSDNTAARSGGDIIMRWFLRVWHYLFPLPLSRLR
jgi:hypothetical protein